MASLVGVFGQLRERYAESGASARELLGVGEKARDETLDLTEHAAMTMVASLILNLDEVMSKE